MVAVAQALLVLLAALLAPQVLAGVEPAITALVDPSLRSSDGRLEGRIEVYHAPEQRVDEQSFRMDSKPLAVEYLLDAKLSPEERQRYPQYGAGDIVSVYRFVLEPQVKGLYILPSIEVTVGGEARRSIPTTYTITAEDATPTLRLEASVTPSGILYPGQRARLTYRISYSKPTELTMEQLPLMEAEGLEKIGGKEIQTVDSTLYSTQEISQEVRILKPGDVVYGPSKIEGRNFREDIRGKRIYEGALLEASAPEITIPVHAFPETDKPLSFTGAIGPIALDVRLTGSPQVVMGDELHLAIALTETAQLDTIRLPDLECQPGFSGFFQFRHFPPLERESTRRKEFTLPLRPTSQEVNNVPSVEFSYFDPQSQRYVVTQSPAIPIVVRAPLKAEAQKPPRTAPEARTTGDETDWRHYLRTPAQSDLQEAIPSMVAYPRHHPMSPWWIAATLFLGLAAIGAQWLLRDDRKRRVRAPQPLNSHDYLHLASKSRHNRAAFSQYVEKALLARLDEAGLEAPTADRLPDFGITGQVKAFLIAMQAGRYGRGPERSPEALLSEAHILLRAIEIC